MKKTRRKMGTRRKQYHATPDQIIQLAGLGKYSRFVDLTDHQKNQLHLFTHSRFKLIREGQGTIEDWQVIVAALLEGHVIASRIFDTEESHEYSREFTRALKLLDACWHSFDTRHEILDSNFDGILDSLNLLNDMKEQMNRKELIDSVTYCKNHFYPALRNAFGDYKPQSFSLEEKRNEIGT